MADNIHEILIKLMWLCIIVGIGVVCTLIMLRIARKAIKKADRDPLLEFFFVNMIKVPGGYATPPLQLQRGIFSEPRPGPETRAPGRSSQQQAGTGPAGRWAI